MLQKEATAHGTQCWDSSGKYDEVIIVRICPLFVSRDKCICSDWEFDWSAGRGVPALCTVTRKLDLSYL